MPPDLRGDKSRQICEAILSTDAWRRARSVAIFAPLAGEPDVEMLWSHAEGRSFAYPRVEGDWLGLYSVRSPFELQPTKWGLREPTAEPANAVAPDSIDLILVPGVAFSRAGARLGRGRGYYDRLLSTLPAGVCKIGVCFDFQLTPELPVEPHDQHVDFIATESGVLSPS
jgi:5-formyltetrahydrofolate cyclo-ligase